MKSLVAGFIGCLLGLAIGYEIASRMFLPKLYSNINQAIRSIDDEQRYAAVLSAGALSMLESGETERAKKTLARQIASYSRGKFDDSLPENQKLKGLIEATSERSSILKEELAKEQK